MTDDSWAKNAAVDLGSCCYQNVDLLLVRKRGGYFPSATSAAAPVACCSPNSPFFAAASWTAVLHSGCKLLPMHEAANYVCAEAAEAELGWK
jgi:hypothetical protein